jgi:sigma-B regulation protein RsbU (phosphoserine phosphatase)
MTMDLVVVDPQAGTLRWASAGHDPPIIYSPVRDAFREVAGGDIPLGLAPGVDYEEYLVEQIEPGSVMVIGTDGIWEAPNGEGELFGKPRLCEVIRRSARETAEGISAEINRALAEFCGRDRFPDDVTFLIIKMWLVQPQRA